MITKITSIAEFKEKLLETMTKNPEKVFISLRENLKKNSPHYKETILHQTRYNILKKEQRSGTTSKNESDGTSNKILMATISIISEIEISDIKPDRLQKTNEITIAELRKKNLLLEKKLANFPVDHVFLRRNDTTKNLRPIAWIKKAKKKVVFKVVSLALSLIGGDLVEAIKDKLNSDEDIIFEFLFYNVYDSPCLKLVTDATKQNEAQIIGTVNECVNLFKELNEEYNNRIRYGFYDSFPTSSLVLIDPELPSGEINIEAYIYEKQPPVEKMHIYLSRESSKKYFDSIYNSIKNDFKVYEKNTQNKITLE